MTVASPESSGIDSPKPSSDWRGVFAIPVTPFTNSLNIDTASLRDQIRFCLDAGAKGIVYPAVASEFFTLSIEERYRLHDLVADEVRGRVPFIAGVSAPSTPISADLARSAVASGAVGVMAMPPFVRHFFDPGIEYFTNHYRAIEEAAGVPIILQNARIGHVVPMSVLGKVVEDVSSVRLLKQETSPSTHDLTKAIRVCGSNIDGVFAGIGGVYLLNELARGARGTMPAPPYVDRLCDAFALYEQNDLEAARRILESLAPLFTYELLYNVSWFKQVLMARGIIKGTACRVPAPDLDAIDLADLRSMLARAGLS